MKKGLLFALIFIVLASVFAQEDLEDVYSDIGEVELEADPGLTPDNYFYVLDLFFESLLIGENPERALQFKEEKIAEIKEMIKQGKIEEAKQIFKTVSGYSELLEREVSPDVEIRTRESSKAVKGVLDELGNEIQGDQWKEVRELIEAHEKKEDEIAISARITAQIKELCEKLSKLDPKEYARTCKTGEDDPKWHKELDKKLTEEQKKEAEEFFSIMSECFQNPGQCKCEDIKITSFADQCRIIAPLAASCQEGNENACNELEKIEDPIDLLPEYLQDVLEEIEERYGEARHDLHIPSECREAGALDRESCMKIMFKLNAPEECVIALEEGKISFTNEREARKACEEIMFKSHAPEECIKENIRDQKECSRLMFKSHAPEECIEAGLTGESREDEKRCREIMESLGERERGGPPVFIVNCKEITDPVERLKCYDSAIQGAEPYIERRGPSGGWPEPCAKENALTRESCEAVMRRFVEREREEFRGREFQDERREQGSPQPIECPEGQFIRCVDNNCGCVSESELRLEEQISPSVTPEEHEVIPSEEVQEEQTQIEQGTEQTEEPTQTQATSEVTGGFLEIDNEFLRYYYGISQK
nr:hypothetical protein [Candidatus Woesearchaeota archaeon]